MIDDLADPGKPPPFTPHGAALILGISVERVRRAIRSGRLHALDLHHDRPRAPRYAIDEADLDHFREKGVRR